MMIIWLVDVYIKLLFWELRSHTAYLEKNGRKGDK
jgi:hypothetical protein